MPGTKARKPKVFFAIPCGDYYSIQNRIIKQVADVADIEAIIVEDHVQTKGLWDKIVSQINSADLFVADISSLRPNIVLELGYAIREKSLERVGIFISQNIAVPADLQGCVVQKYTSFAGFQDKLISWLCDAIPLLDPKLFGGMKVQLANFHDDFRDQESFLKLWSFPPGSSFLLTYEGLRFTNANLPILTTTLALLRDCEFEFRACIAQERVGWVVKGTKDLNSLLPAFCMMFQLDANDNLTPHIWNAKQIHPQSLYQVFPSHKVTIKKSRDGWFTLVTRVQRSTVEIENDKKVVFTADFSTKPYAQYYNDFPYKEGQVGFRCHPGEEAVINYVKVRELYPSVKRQRRLRS
ncbi:MAG TPA: TIR domain-containing protein [Anaerolineales bacterium]|nr:TIR domain-containing protein [Anaerolineales bacterium]